MLSIFDLESYLNELLTPQLFKDYCPNGLQVEGKHEIKTLVTGVSANHALIDKAVNLGADAILVHHGFFWKNENPCLVGVKHQRLSSLIKNNISLFAYHLPLDAHLKFGNNVQLAKKLGLEFSHFLQETGQNSLIASGRLLEALSGEELAKLITAKLQREPLYIPGSASTIRTIAWCTGAAQDFIEQAVAAKVDAYLTGEVSERTVSMARETGIHFFAAGHHATERYGVIAVGEHLADKFAINHINIEIDNPV